MDGPRRRPRQLLIDDSADQGGVGVAGGAGCVRAVLVQQLRQDGVVLTQVAVGVGGGEAQS